MPESYSYDDYPFLPHVTVTGIESAHLRGVGGDFGWKGNAVYAIPGGYTEIFRRESETLELGWAWAPDGSSTSRLLSPLYINDKEWHISSVDDVTRVLEEDQRQAQQPKSAVDVGEPSENAAAIAATVDRSVAEEAAEVAEEVAGEVAGEVAEEVIDERVARIGAEGARYAGSQFSHIAVDCGLDGSSGAGMYAAAGDRDIDHESGADATGNGLSDQLSRDGWEYRTVPDSGIGLVQVNTGESELLSSSELGSPGFDSATEGLGQQVYEAGAGLDPEIDV